MDDWIGRLSRFLLGPTFQGRWALFVLGRVKVKTIPRTRSKSQGWWLVFSDNFVVDEPHGGYIVLSQVMCSIMRACTWATEMVKLNLHFSSDMGSMVDVSVGFWWLARGSASSL